MVRPISLSRGLACSSGPGLLSGHTCVEPLDGRFPSLVYRKSRPEIGSSEALRKWLDRLSAPPNLIGREHHTDNTP
jgi:hypothetical protein